MNSLKCFGLVLLAAMMTGCASTGGDGFKPLFDGDSLAGWSIKCKPLDRSYTFFTVEDGTIVADSMKVQKHDYVWLLTDGEYSDFILRLKFQAYRGNPGNSGIQIRSRYDDAAGWLDGPQIDINPPGPWRTGMIWDETRGVQHWLCPAVPKGQWVDEKMANPALRMYFSDETPAWNDLEITATGGKITASLNGLLITDYDGAGILSDGVHQQHNVGMKGHIALQIHTGDKLRIRFKDIRIKELPR